jgi:hypothetical protein
MKSFLCFLFLLASSSIFSQNLEFSVIVKDVETGLVINEVTITATKTKQGFLTNKNGEATISLKSQSDLRFENSAYKSYIVKFADLNKKVNEVYLESNANRLEEVILTNVPAQEILKTLVRNSLAKISVPVNLKVYLREFYTQNKEITFFNDGLINFQILGNSKSLKTDILVEQNRAIGFLDKDIKKDLLGYDLNNIIENYYQFKYIDEILVSNAKKKYEFQVKSFPSNEDYLVLKVTPIDTAKGVLSDFTIIYDRNQMLIIELSSLVPDSRLEDLRRSFLNSSKIFKLEFKNTFRIENDLYYLANSKEVIGFEKKYKKESKRIEVNNHMVVTNFSKDILKYSENNVFKEKSLINRKTEFFTNYWDIESGFVSTKEEKEIIEKLSHL